MNNKLKVALRCTKYFLVAALIALPFFGPETTEAKAEEGYYHKVYENDICDSGSISICHNQPGSCPSESIACNMEEIVVWG